MHSARARPNGPAARAGTEGTAENMTLAQLPVGQSARIAAVGGEGALRRRLLDMGLTHRGDGAQNCPHGGPH